jgi:putative transposase
VLLEASFVKGGLAGRAVTGCMNDGSRFVKRFTSPRHTQRCLSAHDPINNLFHLRRDHVTANQYRAARTQAFAIWTDITGARIAA